MKDPLHSCVGARSSAAEPDAFTRTDLAVSVGVVVLLAALWLPALASSANDSGSALVCMNNLKRLTHAWHLFAADHAGGLPGNLDGGYAATNRTWCAGWIDNSTFTPDNTNWGKLMQSQLGPYSGTLAIYKCPADQSLSRGLTGEPRVRSVSMSGYVGVMSAGRPYTAGYHNFARLDSIQTMSPAQLFVFIDEREDSINDACFQVNMTGFDPPNPDVFQIVDWPGAYHAGGASLSFADGHTEHWIWKDPRTAPPLRPARLLPLGVASPDNPDVERLQWATSRKVSNPTR